MDETDQRWYLTYKMEGHPEGLARGEIPEEHGACDAALLISVVLPQDGSYSQCTVSLDGRVGRPMTASDQFKAWLVLAAGLAQNPDLDPERRQFARLVWKAYQPIRSADIEEPRN